MSKVFYIGQPKAYDTFLAQTKMTRSEVTLVQHEHQLRGLRDATIIKGFAWFEYVPIDILMSLSEDNSIFGDHHTGVEYFVHLRIEG